MKHIVVLKFLQGTKFSAIQLKEFLDIIHINDILRFLFNANAKNWLDSYFLFNNKIYHNFKHIPKIAKLDQIKVEYMVLKNFIHIFSP
jgi:hypothetical protein